MKWLTLQDLELLHMQIIDASGGSEGVREVGRLKSALAAQRQEVFGEELYPTIHDKAAVLLRGIIADHAFVDGNKRTGVMAALLFLNLNGVDTSALEDQELEDFAVSVATDHLSVEQIAAWLEEHSKMEEK